MSRKENNKTEPCVILRPASSGETGLFYALSKDLDEKFGTVGHLSINFGSNGHEFWHTWWPCDYERPYSSAFESDLKMVVDALRDNGPLERFSAMQQYCSVHDGKSRVAVSRTKGMSWKQSITATACAAILPPEITRHT